MTTERLKAGVTYWFDSKLGSMPDVKLAQLVGVSRDAIRNRRVRFGIAVYSAFQAVEPYRHLLGVESDRHISKLSGASVPTVKAYRQSLGIELQSKTRPSQQPQLIPEDHPIKPYKALLGLVPDQDVARLSGMSNEEIAALRELFSLDPAEPLPELSEPNPLEDYHGPLIGYESLFGTMSIAKISRQVGVPFSVVENRQKFFGVEPPQRISRIARYEHLLGVIPNNLVALLAGVSVGRVAQYRTQKAHERS